MQQLRLAIQHLNDENGELSSSLSKALHEAESYRSQTTTLQEQINSLSQSKEAIRAELEELKEDCDSRVLQAKSSTVAECNALLNKKEDENQHLTIELASIHRELEATRAENDELIHQQSVLKRSQDETLQRATQAEKTRDELQEEVERHKRMEGELRDLVTRGQESCEALKASAEEKEREAASLRETLAKKEAEAKEAKEIGGAKESEVSELHEKMEKQDQLVKEVVLRMKDNG